MKNFLFIIINLIFITNLFAADRVINLVVDYKIVNFAGKQRKAIAVNNQIPAPTLYLKEGDKVTINVHNRLDEETAIHWHGILLPWQMDGVLGVTQQGISPGHVFHYRFTLQQSGTYWYHAHAGLQEQEGLYGAIVIDPIKPILQKYNKDYVVVLSDWSNTSANQIFANLKKDGDYYSANFPLQPSLMKFIHDYRRANSVERRQLINDYLMMQQMRMSLYDINDIAYDAFLMNGHPKNHPWTAPVNVGDSVRLRFIGAAASTIFHVKIFDTKMQMFHVQGNDVNRYQMDDFTIAPGETTDILIHIKKNTPYIIYLESTDKVGAIYGALTTVPQQIVNYKKVLPFPEPLPVTREMMINMKDMHSNASHIEAMSGHHQHMTSISSHMNMSMPTEPTIIEDKITSSQSTPSETYGTKYQSLIAAVKTNNPHRAVTGTIKMELFGYMDRFIWFINGVPEYLSKPIILDPAKRYRFVFTNHSMMHHPMHIHGHWFILRNGHGSYDPLLHTIDVPPGSTVTADVDTDASGQWFFHCHMLYHMFSGMGRVFQYSTLIQITKDEIKPENIVKQTAYHNRPIVRVDEIRPIDVSLVEHPMPHPMNLFFATFLDVSMDPFKNFQNLTYKGLYGRDWNKIELFTNDAEMNEGKVENADIDIFYWHLISQFWAIKGGVNYFYRPATTPYWQPGIGIEGLMPYFIDTNVRGYYYGGSAKLDIEFSRDTQVSNNFIIRLGIRSILASQTVQRASIGSSLNQMRYIIRPYYRVMPNVNLFVEYEYEKNYGAFKILQNNIGEASIQNTLSLGLGLLF